MMGLTSKKYFSRILFNYFPQNALIFLHMQRFCTYGTVETVHVLSSLKI